MARLRASLGVALVLGAASCFMPSGASASSLITILLSPRQPAQVAAPALDQAPVVAALPDPATPAPVEEPGNVEGAPANSGAPPTTPRVLIAPPVEPHTSGFPFVYPDAQMEAVDFAVLPGWSEDRQEAALKALQTSCGPILRSTSPPRAAQPVWFALRELCPRALALGPRVPRGEARAFFETEFRAVRLVKTGDTQGFLTGYYEPEVEASRERTDEFPVPFHGRPFDLVSARPLASGGFDARASAGRVVAGRMIPYFDRGEIEAGALAGRGLELAFVRDPVEVLFTQIQGSARLRFADGSTMRIGYAAHNGHRYVPVGRVLIDRGHATREQMSMDFIRAWMAQNRDAAHDVRRQNRSYVFFRIKTELTDEDGPIGGQGVPIMAWRSIAIDRNIHSYGTPVYIDGILPTGSSESGEPFRRLMIAQDTGSAILGPARGDLFIGTGPEAGSVSGRIRHRADWYVLLPFAVSPSAHRVPVPLPRPR